MTPKIIQYESLPSTMDEARALASDGAPEWTCVQAGEQTAGRGRFGNQWSSPVGNMYMTVILRPRVELRYVAQMSFAVALALSDAIGRDDVKLKWPNDVLAGGRKIAGILLETQGGKHAFPDYLLIGTGLNVASAPPGCALLNENGQDHSIVAVRDAYLGHLAHWYDRWLRAGFADIREAWISRATGIGDPVVARLAGKTLQGTFEGIDEHGNLLLRQNDGHARPINSGEVHFAPAAAPSVG